MKVFITGTKGTLGHNSICINNNLISGDRPYHLDIDRNGDHVRSIRFIYPENEPKIKEKTIGGIKVRFGPATGRIYYFGSSKAVPGSIISSKLSACKKVIANHLKSRDLRTLTNLDFGIKTIRKSLNIEEDS